MEITYASSSGMTNAKAANVHFRWKADIAVFVGIGRLNQKRGTHCRAPLSRHASATGAALG